MFQGKYTSQQHNELSNARTDGVQNCDDTWRITSFAGAHVSVPVGNGICLPLSLSRGATYARVRIADMGGEKSDPKMGTRT